MQTRRADKELTGIIKRQGTLNLLKNYSRKSLYIKNTH